RENQSSNDIIVDSRYAVDLDVYIQNETKFGNRWNLMYGLRYSGVDYSGGAKEYEFDEEGKTIKSEDTDRWKTVKYYQGIEPRLSTSFVISENNSIKLGYNRIFQYLHQLSNSTTSSPTDNWVPSSHNVKPQI